MEISTHKTSKEFQIQNESKLKFFKTHTRTMNKEKPHQEFRNWKQLYQVPWIPFLEFSIIILYFIFVYLHQRSAIDITLDFTKIIKNFFLDGFDFETDDDGKIITPGKIYFVSKFIDVVNQTGHRFLAFPDEIPFAAFIENDGVVQTEITVRKDKNFFNFSEENMSELFDVVRGFTTNFDLISLTATYQMYLNDDPNNEKFVLSISFEFSFNRNTKIVSFNLLHSRIHNLKPSDWNHFWESPLITIPLLIALLSFITIIITSYYVWKIYKYSSEKAQMDFVSKSHIFLSKFDFWIIFALLFHLISIVSSVLYAISSSDYNPVSMIFLVISTFTNCFLMIRYLKLKESTNLIIMVIKRGSIKILQFLIGCIIIYFAFLILGCSLLGSYDTTFKSFIDGAECLLAVIHGDSIQGMFDDASNRPNISMWFGIIYWLIWIFFSLTIMFNVSISIFEEVLSFEINRAKKLKEKKRNKKIHKSDQIEFTLPISYSTDF